MESLSNQGALYVVATPIGNLQDISFRALEILKNVDVIAVEDSRHSKKLLRHYNIGTKCISLHEHNEREITSELIEKLFSGTDIALVSDAGTPLVSDPGYYLIKTARQANVTIIPIPGACALIAALSVSGLPTNRFCFEGFLPAKSHARQQRLSDLAQETRTLVFYESPHRILDTVHDMETVFGSTRSIVLAKELTKIHETVFKGSVAALREWLLHDPVRQKGEIVMVMKIV